MMQDKNGRCNHKWCWQSSYPQRGHFLCLNCYVKKELIDGKVYINGRDIAVV